jgi:hypothetical protein
VPRRCVARGLIVVCSFQSGALLRGGDGARFEAQHLVLADPPVAVRGLETVLERDEQLGIRWRWVRWRACVCECRGSVSEDGRMSGERPGFGQRREKGGAKGTGRGEGDAAVEQ